MILSIFKRVSGFIDSAFYLRCTYKKITFSFFLSSGGMIPGIMLLASLFNRWCPLRAHSLFTQTPWDGNTVHYLVDGHSLTASPQHGGISL